MMYIHQNEGQITLKENEKEFSKQIINSHNAKFTHLNNLLCNS